MRLWTLHPKYLDAKGIVALWREALLAQAVLRGLTRGYRHHPQLDRFRSQAKPRSAINAYLAGVHAESLRRGYRFDARKCRGTRMQSRMSTTSGQLKHEWQHLLAKLKARSPVDYGKWKALRRPQAHPLFKVVPGPVAEWERR
ncbi:MAG TPA: pyrimidine dimer DNA glycosylase/endonuclease V [Burkholderiales bacterium]